MYFKYGFGDLASEEEDFSCASILARYQSIFYAYYSEKIRNTDKMYMKNLTYLISRI